MELIAKALTESEDIHIVDSLRQIIGPSGLGSAFEYHAHKKFINEVWVIKLYEITKNGTSPNISRRRINIQGVKRFWDINNISELTSKEYGLPITSNFPLVDAIIQPNILIQFTTSSTSHRGAVDKLDEIRQNLRGKEGDHIMIFVVPSGNLRKFKYQPALKIPQFVMSAEDTASMPPPQKKRKTCKWRCSYFHFK